MNEHNDGLYRNTSSELSQTTSNTHQLGTTLQLCQFQGRRPPLHTNVCIEVITLVRFSSSSAYEKEKHREVKLRSLGRRKL